MEELLQHCMRELAFDGDLGCDVSRLRHFIQGFYLAQSPPGNQNVDDEFYAFVWGLLVQQPSVRVGLVPHGATIEVYIAPQPSKKTKVTKPKKKVLVPEPASFPALDGLDITADVQNSDQDPKALQMIEEVATWSLERLIEQYGSNLRVAVDPEASFRAITGSHVRPAKLSPMVYTALQLISRGREGGLSVIDLGKKTGYDQKTCYYLIEQLKGLDLVIKLSQGGPGGGNFCIHKYFYARSPFWEGVRREEAAGGDEDDENPLEPIGSQVDSPSKLHFDPIDSRHLTSTQLIKSRLVRLLKNSENGLHSYQNLLVTIGFAKPIKRDRRFFTGRIRELIKERVIEKVIVPNNNGTLRSLCIRLVEDRRSSDVDGIIVQPGDVGDEEQEAETLEDQDSDMPMMPVMNLTIHRQILALLEEAGPKGLTVNNMSTQLGMLDKRTIELFLCRLERDPPPSHLADLTICDFIENKGRERRHRYYTLAGYLSLVQTENIDLADRTAQYTSKDFSQSGGFSIFSDNLFYKDEAALVKYGDEYRGKAKPPKGGGTRKLGQPRKDGAKSRKEPMPEREASMSQKPSRKRGKTAKPIADTESGDDQPVVPQKSAQKGTKRKRRDDGEEDEPESQPALKQRRGRSVKKIPQTEGSVTDMDSATAAPVQEKKRGRPRRATAHSSLENAGSQDINPDSADAGNSKTSNEFSITPHPNPLPSEPVGKDGAVSSTEWMSGDGPTLPVVAGVSGPDPLGIIHPIPLSHSTAPIVGKSALPRRLPASPPFDLQIPSVSRPPDASVERKRKLTKDTAVHVDEPPAKRPKSGRPRRTHELINISQLRAENELMRVVEASGGIANVSSNKFFETYQQIVSTMTEAGEATSMPVGTQPDRRTIRKILDRLEDRGRIKTVTVTLAPRLSQARLIKLVYESAVSQERLDQYLSALRDNVPVPSAPVHKKLEQPVVFTKPRRERNPVLTQDGADDDGIRSTLLSEGRTVAQFYGFLIGRARRARELHQFTLTHMQGPILSSHIVSRSERIVAFPYYCHDLPISTYFAIISTTEYNVELSKLMETHEGRQTLVKNLPLALHDQLKIGRLRARDKVLALLNILASLKLVTPLQPSTSNTPSLTCEPNGDYPVQFDIVPITKLTATPYWRFNTIAPIHFYSLATSWPPPFHRDIFVRTADESMTFWSELERACLDKGRAEPMTSMDSITGPCTCSPQVASWLRRRQSWVSSYVLSSNQKRYLRQRWMDPSTGYIPLSDQDGSWGLLEHISYVISAPIDVVHNFFVTAQSVLAKEADRIRNRDEQRQEAHRNQQATENRASLAKKAAEARRQVKVDWEALVARVHPAPLPYGSVTRLKDLRKLYLQSKGRMTTQKWEAAVMEAIEGPRRVKRRPILPTMVSSTPRRTFRVSTSNLPPVTTNPQTSVQELIDRYKNMIAAMPQKKRKEVTSGDADPGPTPPRRQRFQWTPEYDELARDASAILRARCRTWCRMDWTALNQLFPFLPRNNVRQRIATLKQEAGGESYFRLLEDKWHELWLDHRGTEALPDDTPDDPAEFDAIGHVEFLRKYIDKRALRIGLSDTTVQHAAGAVLTETVADFFSRWTVDENVGPSNKMDFMWTSIGDEHREKTLLGEAFSVACDVPRPPVLSNPLSNGIAESALKMTLTTADEEYDAENAALLLNSIGKDAVCQASEELLARGVIAEATNRHRKKPGRNLKISALNEDALGGSFPIDFFSEAGAIEDLFEDGTGDWREWSPIATGGEMAALIELISEKKVAFRIDTTGPAAHRPQLDWNSKKVDDDQIETALTMRCHPSTVLEESLFESPAPASTGMEIEKSDSTEHGRNGGESAPCHKTSRGIITCSTCVESDRQSFLAGLDLKNKILSTNIIDRLDGAGRRGLVFEALVEADPSESGDIAATIQRMTSHVDPLCYWVGYTHPVLVSRPHIAEWTVSIPGLTPRLVFPRRWLNIKGEKMSEVWNAGLRAVVGVLIARPGISQAELRQRLMSVYDRQELNDLLHHLGTEELIVQRWAPDDPSLACRDIRGMGKIEEQKIYWVIKTNSWYRVHE